MILIFNSHVGKIQDKPKEFYEEFQVIIAGLDNIEARRWLNQTIHSLVEFENGEPKPETVRVSIFASMNNFFFPLLISQIFFPPKS